MLKMQTIFVTFDELLHIHRNPASRSTPKHTVFSFMSSFKYTPYVTVPGFPRLEPGMRVAAAFRDPGNWKTLVGWRDLDTGDLVAPEYFWHPSRIAFICIWLILFLSMLGSPFTFMSLNFLAIVICVIFTTFDIVAWRRTRTDLKYLNALPYTNEC